MLMPEIKRQLKKGNRVNLLYFDIKNFTKIENEYGGDLCYEILSFLVRQMLQLKQQFVRDRYRVELVYGGGDDFIFLFFHPFRSGRELENICLHIKGTVLKGYAHSGYPALDLYYSHTSIRSDSRENLDHLIYRELKSASLKAKDAQYRFNLEQKGLMAAIVSEKMVYPVYQPIISLHSGMVFGREALTRSHERIKMPPNQLFDIARKTGMLLKFERLTRELAIQGGQRRHPGEKLFINITPEIINELNFQRGETHKFLREFAYQPEDIVLEITENSAIKDFKLFRQVVEHYRTQGFQIAVDDAGSGFSTLQVIAELHPDFIKVDMSLVRDIDKTPLKMALVEALADFSRKTGVQLIAEGIETFAELERLLDLGIDLGQGYLIARPGEIQQPLNPRALEVIRQRSRVRELEQMVGACQLKEVIEFNQAVSQDTLVKEVVDAFNNFPGMQGLVVVNADQVPVGLVMKDYLYYKLGSAYGVSLFMRRPICNLMDKSPLIIDIQKDLNSVARMAMERDHRKLYDFVIVTQYGKYYGTIPVRSLLEKISQLQVELARDANPLTGLPRNHLIQKELSARLTGREPFGVMYDEIITRMADWCTAAQQLAGEAEGFVGHVGGDDFLLNHSGGSVGSGG